MIKAMTLIHRLEELLGVQGDKNFLRFLGDGEQVTATLTYSEILRNATHIASCIIAKTELNDRVLLVFEAGPRFIETFIACLMARRIAVPCVPPTGKRFVSRLDGIANDCGAKLIVTSDELKTLIKRREEAKDSGTVVQLRVGDEVTYDILSDGDIDRAPRSDVKLRNRTSTSDIAFLQYTSGSTSMPKGVIVTHGNLMANLQMIFKSFRFHSNSVMVSWLPHYHDMGLIGGILQPMFAGASLVSMAPAHFLQKPSRWLGAVSKFKATVSGAPNFAFELVTKKTTASQISEMDLSSVEVLYNGAEPIRAATMKRFLEYFSACRFSAKALLPCYGLAEATLLVSGRDAGSDLRSAKMIDSSTGKVPQGQVSALEQMPDDEKQSPAISCGLPTCDVAVVEPVALQALDDMSIGEVWVCGDHVSHGYWSRQQESLATFQNHPILRDGSIDQRPYLRTGDLGFMHQGQLYLVGRLKDLLIVGGRNIYPQDIEFTVEEASLSVRKSFVAAFSIDFEGHESLCIVAELDPRKAVESEQGAVIDAITAAIGRDHELSTGRIALIKAGSLPKTSSGKVQRALTKSMFLSNELPVIARWEQASYVSKKADVAQRSVVDVQKSETRTANAISNQTPRSVRGKLGEEVKRKKLISISETSSQPKDCAAFLLDWLKQKSKNPQVITDLDTSFTKMGLDSVDAFELSEALENFLGTKIAVRLLWEHPTVRQLSEHLSRKAS